MNSMETHNRESERFKKDRQFESKKQEIGDFGNANPFKLRKVEEKEKKGLIDDRRKQEFMDQEKLADIRSRLGMERISSQREWIFRTKESTTDLDVALGELVLENYPDKIVEQILSHVPEGFSIQDNNLGDVEKSIRMWLTESAGNAARHIDYRQKEEPGIQYEIGIYCANITEGEKKYLQITMIDNGIGIRPENLEKIGNEYFTTSKEHEEVGGKLHVGGHGRFSVEYKNEIAIPRGWEIEIKNREDGSSGAISSLKIPLMKSEKNSQI